MSPCDTRTKNAPTLQPRPRREPMPMSAPPMIAHIASSRVVPFHLNSLCSSAITAAPPISASDIQSAGLIKGFGRPFSRPK